MDKIIVYFKKNYLFLIVLILVIIGGIFVYNFCANDDVDDNILSSDVIFNTNQLAADKNDYISVDVKGAVLNPGVYEVPVDSRLIDLLEIAGGIREEADLSIMNLSHRLADEDVVIIYTKFEVEEMKSGSTSTLIIEKECVCPKIDSVGCIDKSITNVGPNTETNNSSTNGKVSLNKATKKELETLPGIGASKAEAIIVYRDTNGGFKSIEELKNVKGIGDATYEKLKDFITI